MSDLVATRIADGVAHVTLNRPEKRNALNRLTIAAMISALQECKSNPAVRVVQITGAGATFCAGADLDEMQAQAQASESANVADARQLAALLAELDSLPKPTVARVNGDGYGGALGLLGACDIVVVADHAKFAFTEVRLGLIPAVISPFVLTKIGEHAARRYFLTAETLTAVALLEIGLAHQVVATGMLDATCLDVTDSLMKAAPGALAEAKALIRDVCGLIGRDKATISSEMGERLARLRIQAEAREGFSAFFAKRKASWQQ